MHITKLSFLSSLFLRKLKKLQLNMVFFDKCIIYKENNLNKIQYTKQSIMKAMKILIEKKLLKISIIASIILMVFAYLAYKFLTNFLT